MKNTFRFIAFAVCALMMLSVFASCGDTSGADASSAETGSVYSVGEISLPSVPTVSISDPTSTISIPEVHQNDSVTLVSLGAEFACLTLDTADFAAYLKEHPDWKDPGYDVSSWQVANAPLGDRVNGSSPVGWGGEGSEPHGLLAVTTFEIEDLAALEGLTYSMNIFYDNTIYMYINGNLVYSDDSAVTGEGVDWLDNYEDKEFTEDIGQYLVEGTNTVAVSLLDGWGGRELDFTVTAK